MFIVSGEKKAHAVKRVLEGEDNPDEVPAHLVRPEDGVVMWLLDAAAASQLSRR
jgi:6-phosphogluconolactonase